MGKGSRDIVTTVLSPVTGAFNYVSNKQQEQRREIRTAMDQQRDEQRRQEQELKKRREDEQKSYANLAIKKAAILAKRSSAVSNRSGTILTSPTGLPGNIGGTGGKTLLGS